jgi:hypothetical protein
MTQELQPETACTLRVRNTLRCTKSGIEEKPGRTLYESCAC